MLELNTPPAEVLELGIDVAVGAVQTQYRRAGAQLQAVAADV